MNKINVEFKGGESRVNPLQACTYMLASCEVDGEPVELYSEIVVKDSVRRARHRLRGRKL